MYKEMTYASLPLDAATNLWVKGTAAKRQKTKSSVLNDGLKEYNQ